MNIQIFFRAHIFIRKWAFTKSVFGDRKELKYSGEIFIVIKNFGTEYFGSVDKENFWWGGK